MHQPTLAFLWIIYFLYNVGILYPFIALPTFPIPPHTTLSFIRHTLLLLPSFLLLFFCLASPHPCGRATTSPPMLTMMLVTITSNETSYLSRWVCRVASPSPFHRHRTAHRIIEIEWAVKNNKEYIPSPKKKSHQSKKSKKGSMCSLEQIMEQENDVVMSDGAGTCRSAVHFEFVFT